MFRLKSMLSHAVLCAPAESGVGGAPAVITTPAAPTKDDIVRIVADQVGKSVAEAMKSAEETVRERDNTPSSKRWEVKQSDLVRAGKRDAGKAGLHTASFLGWMMRGGGNPDAAYRIAKKAGADEIVVRALGESTMAGGGAFVPQAISEDYIELLYNAAPFLSAGPRRVPVPSGNLTVPKVTAGATATWGGESNNISRSEQTFGQRRLDLKKLSVLTPISNELLRDSSPALDQIVRDDLANNAAVVIDAALIRGTGTVYAPRGVYSQVASANKFNANATANVANVTADLNKSMRLIEDAKVRFVRPAWFISPTVKYGLMAARDANGALVWAPEMATGKLYGIPFFVTQNIPSNLGGSTDESEVYLVEMSHVMVGDDPMGVQVSMVDGAAYHDGAAVVAGFSRDESVVRLIQRIDMILRQDGNEAAVMEQVDWDIISAT
jgi:HK97 family phage major capsid protein